MLVVLIYVVSIGAYLLIAMIVASVCKGKKVELWSAFGAFWPLIVSFVLIEFLFVGTWRRVDAMTSRGVDFVKNRKQRVLERKPGSEVTLPKAVSLFDGK